MLAVRLFNSSTTRLTTRSAVVLWLMNAATPRVDDAATNGFHPRSSTCWILCAFDASSTEPSETQMQPPQYTWNPWIFATTQLVLNGMHRDIKAVHTYLLLQNGEAATHYQRYGLHDGGCVSPYNEPPRQSTCMHTTFPMHTHDVWRNRKTSSFPKSSKPEAERVGRSLTFGKAGQKEGSFARLKKHTNPR